MSSGEVIVYGAGMSGLVAAYNLACEGRKVLVRERESSFGGSSMFNPSTHTTPLDLAATSDYIGIDISPAFVTVGKLSLYLHDLLIDAPVFMSYHVERGSRPQSLDTLLYSKCVEAGVEFEFDRALEKGELEKLPRNTIIACGLNAEAYQYLDIPHDYWYAWQARGEVEHAPDAWIWLDECINEYGYISYANGIYFNLLFSYGEGVDREALEKYRDFMRRMEGVEEENWEYVHGVTPISTPENPQLFRKDLIMCGTISGMIDPLMGFGISGGLVSGKVAAMAVADPEAAAAEFERFTRNFARVFNFKRGVWLELRKRVDLLEDFCRIIGPERTIQVLISALRIGRKTSAIPGFSPMSCS